MRGQSVREDSVAGQDRETRPNSPDLADREPAGVAHMAGVMKLTVEDIRQVWFRRTNRTYPGALD
jgi:hypothetical protein